MRNLRAPNCKHRPERDMDYVQEWRLAGMLIEEFFCRICRRRMRYTTRPRTSRKSDAELAVTTLVMDSEFDENRRKKKPRRSGAT